jgi:hypothetical protein
MPTAQQMDMEFPIDHEALKEFLLASSIIEEKMKALREEKKVLKQGFADDLPLKAIMSAVRINTAKKKIASDRKEPLSIEYQEYLEGLINTHIESEREAQEKRFQEAQDARLPLELIKTITFNV